MRAHLVGEQVSALLSRTCGQQRSLASGTGAQIEPALVTAFEWGLGGDERNQLAALVLNPCPRVPDRLDPAGVSPDQDDGQRTDPPQPRLDLMNPVGLPGGLGQGLRGDETGSGSVLSATRSASSSSALRP